MFFLRIKYFLKNLLVLIPILSLPFYSNVGLASIFNVSENWFDYGNGAINLSNVSRIIPFVEYNLTLSQDEEFSSDGIQFTPYSEDWSFTRENKLSDVKSWLNYFKDEPYYFFKLNMGINFDGFELSYYDETFLYIPNPNEENNNLQELTNDDKFIEFVDLLKNSFSDLDYSYDFSSDYIKLLENVKILNDDDIKTIDNMFKDILNDYNDITK